MGLVVTSVRELCEREGYAPRQTGYRDTLPEMLDFKIVSGDFYELSDPGSGTGLLSYKNTVRVADFPMVSELLPPLESMSCPMRDKLPYFAAGLDGIADALDQGEQVYVEGGPCLFGTSEVTVEVVCRGRRRLFDYNTGKAYQDDAELEGGDRFSDYVVAHAAAIEAIHFENHKTALTFQEWLFIKYPFEMARVLGAPVALPLPDMSYIKYLEAVLADVAPQVRSAALAEFRSVAFEVSDLYLDVIDQLRALYPAVRCEVVHARDEDLCRRFYEVRAPFIERNKVIKRLTSIPAKLEPIKDYVSMPALGLYLFGLRSGIEVDSMDETDSFRKCRFAHKRSLNLGCVLVPEMLSDDGQHTLFEAAFDLKGYGDYVVA